jgi:DNA-binding MarR family transcriptional regulator/N-acetylglutamate synthase-like GNAT family acetyltransferase
LINRIDHPEGKEIMMSEELALENIDRIRRFNRFYTKRIGLLGQGLLKTRFPLTQARIIFELAQQDHLTASDLINMLGIDPGYLSRILRGFEQDGLILRKPSEKDNRQRLLKLTLKGRKSFNVLNNRSRQEIHELIKGLSEEDRLRLLSAMENIEEIFGDGPATLFRSHRPGDIGWIIHRQGLVYSQEYGWDETFEGLVAEILAKFIKKHDPDRERIWIAEQQGKLVGSIMIVDAGDGTAQLRLLFVDPEARGRGIGKRLIEESVLFSKKSGYKRIKLWTQSNLLEARRLYQKAGFVINEKEPHHSFGHDLIAEIWELPLQVK